MISPPFLNPILLEGRKHTSHLFHVESPNLGSSLNPLCLLFLAIQLSFAFGDQTDADLTKGGSKNVVWKIKKNLLLTNPSNLHCRRLELLCSKAEGFCLCRIFKEEIEACFGFWQRTAYK